MDLIEALKPVRGNAERVMEVLREKGVSIDVARKEVSSSAKEHGISPPELLTLQRQLGLRMSRR